ncbi:hypothetical protein Bbelb_383580 [Branchiostoma belcheri]|nr:hypothetical protein Bbelb_383580 [Branchiostoma belcheri]
MEACHSFPVSDLFFPTPQEVPIRPWFLFQSAKCPTVGGRKTTAAPASWGRGNSTHPSSGTSSPRGNNTGSDNYTSTQQDVLHLCGTLTLHSWMFVGLHQKADRALLQGSPDICRLHIPPNMSDFPQRLHKFTEALKGLVQNYTKVTVWDHRRLWRRNPNYFAPHARSLMLPPDPPRNLEVHSSSGNNPPFKILATGMRLTAYTCPIWETSSITRVNASTVRRDEPADEAVPAWPYPGPLRTTALLSTSETPKTIASAFGAPLSKSIETVLLVEKDARREHMDALIGRFRKSLSVARAIQTRKPRSVQTENSPCTGQLAQAAGVEIRSPFAFSQPGIQT